LLAHTEDTTHMSCSWYKTQKKSYQESKGYPPKRPYPPRFLRQTAPHWVVTQPQLVRPTQFTSLHRIASAPQVSHELCSQAGFIPLVLLFAEKCSAVAIWCCHRHRVAPLSLDKLHGHVPPRKTARNWLSFDWQVVRVLKDWKMIGRIFDPRKRVC